MSTYVDCLWLCPVAYIKPRAIMLIHIYSVSTHDKLTMWDMGQHSQFLFNKQEGGKWI